MRFYRQCVLRRGTTSTVSWIPEEFAQKHRPVELKKADGSWENGWLVVKVGPRQDEVVVRKLEDAHRRQRGMSDI